MRFTGVLTFAFFCMENTQYQSEHQPIRTGDTPDYDSTLIESVVIPVIDEQVQIDKRTVETGRVRISKTVQEREETVDIPLEQEVVEIERVPINQRVDTPPAVRYEGDTTVYPVLEEVVVVEKRLMLIEEVRVTKRRTTITEPQQVVLRRETVHVERTAPEAERPAPQNGPSL